MAIAEILAVVADEMVEMDVAIQSCLDGLLNAPDDAGFEEQKEAYAEQVERLVSVADTLDLKGLSNASKFVQLNMRMLDRENADPEKLKVFGQWPKLVIGYLHLPKEGVYSSELGFLFTYPEWPMAMSEEEAEILNERLLEVSQMDSYDDASQDSEYGDEKRQTVAEPEDLELRFPEDINPLLSEAFLTEGPGQAVEFSQTVQKFTNATGTIKDVDIVRRLVHNIKGSANTVGIRGIASFSHHVEDILDFCIDSAYIPEGDLAHVLVEVGDIIEIMFDAVVEGGAAPDHSLDVLQHVLDIGNQIDNKEYYIGGVDVDLGDQGQLAHEPISEDAFLDASAFPEGDEPASYFPESEIPAPLAGSQRAPEPVQPASQQQVQQQGQGHRKFVREAVEAKQEEVVVKPKVRVAVDTIDEMLRYSGEISISRSHIQERLEQAKRMLAEYKERDMILAQRVTDLEHLVSTQGVESVKQRSLSVVGSDMSGLDPLEMDQYTELHTHVQELAETVSDNQMMGRNIGSYLGDIDGSLREVALLNTELHELIMTSRLVSANALEHRLQRIVRQAARAMDKNVNLHFVSNDVMLDDQMVNNLVDPLQHLLRNAVVHGLESTTQRSERGKHQEGNVTLSFARDGNYLSISCEDDGQGLDLMTIYEKALSRGLVTSEQNLSEAEIERLILQPGFTTTEGVTELAGRGVGMDVVNSNVRSLKGNITIQNRPGEGVKFTLRMPLTMGIVNSIIITVNDQTFAVSNNNLNRIVHNGTDNVVLLSGQWYYQEGDLTCPTFRLSELLNLHSIDGFGKDTKPCPIILVEDSSGTFAIAVDSVLSSQDLVIKTLGAFVGNLDGVLGASILGTGQVVYILDLQDLIELHQRAGKTSGDKTAMQRSKIAPAAPVQSVPEVLIVDDSLSTRTALSLTLSEHGYQYQTASDGMDAIDAIELKRPAVILLDMEMPRMNGLELTAHVRSQASISGIPIIMITSRTGKKHRVLAQEAGVNEYLTKPYSDKQLLSLIANYIEGAA